MRFSHPCRESWDFEESFGASRPLRVSRTEVPVVRSVFCCGASTGSADKLYPEIARRDKLPESGRGGAAFVGGECNLGRIFQIVDEHLRRAALGRSPVAPSLSVGSVREYYWFAEWP